MSAIIPFLPLFIRELGVTELKEVAYWSGLIYAAPFLTSFFMQPVWGILGDKFGRKPMAARALFGLGLAQIMIYFAPGVVSLFIIRLFQGMLSGFNIAAMSLIASSFPKERVSYSMSMLQSALNGGIILGPFIGGTLAELFGFRFVFLFAGLILLILGIVVIVSVTEYKSDDLTKLESSLIQNLKYIFNSKAILFASVIILITSLGLSLLRPVFVLYVETFNIHPKLLTTYAGGLYSIAGLFSTITSIMVAKRIDVFGPRKLLLISSAGAGIMYICHYFVQDIYLLIPVRILLGAFYGIITPTLFIIINNHVTPSRKSGIISIGSSFQILGIVIGSISSGTIVGIFGIKESFIIAGFCFLLINVIYLFKRKSI